MDHSEPAPGQRLVFGGQLPFGNKPAPRPTPPSGSAAQPSPAEPTSAEPTSAEQTSAEPSPAEPAAVEPAVVERVPAESAVWDVTRPEHLPPLEPVAEIESPAGDERPDSEQPDADLANGETVVEAEPVPEYPDPPQTGDAAVDQVLLAVALAVGGPLEEQPAVYDAAHRTLQDRLADVEG